MNNIIEKFITMHGTRYSYEKVDFKNTKTLVIITCKIHGDFLQKPEQHLKGSHCPICAYENRSKTRKTNNNWKSYSDAKKFVHTLHITRIEDWYTYAKSTSKPRWLPSNPRSVYSSEWEGWGEWLGKSNKIFYSYEESKAWAHTQDIKSWEHWLSMCREGKRPLYIPFNPKEFYAEEWEDWATWIGKTTKQNGNVPGFLYFIKSSLLPQNVIKVGRTYRSRERMLEHKRKIGKISIEETLNVTNMNKGEQIIKQIASQYGTLYKGKEYFSINNLPNFIKECKHVLQQEQLLV